MLTDTLHIIVTNVMRARSVTTKWCQAIERLSHAVSVSGRDALAVVLGALLLVACSSEPPARFSAWGSKSFPAKEASFEVAIFDSVLPERSFERIARIEVAMDMPASSEPSLQDALPELKRQARLAGADAIVDIRLARSTAGSITRFQVNATGIRYSQN